MSEQDLKNRIKELEKHNDDLVDILSAMQEKEINQTNVIASLREKIVSLEVEKKAWIVYGEKIEKPALFREKKTAYAFVRKTLCPGLIVEELPIYYVIPHFRYNGYVLRVIRQDTANLKKEVN